MIEVIFQKCVGCKQCLKACAYDAINIVEKVAEIDVDKCTLCGACVSACKFDAIIIRKHGQKKIDRSLYKDVWVFAEHKDGEIASVVTELLGKGRELADIIENNLVAVIMGKDVKSMAQELIGYGADKVICVENPALEHFTDLAYANAFTTIADKYKPEIILSGATVTGRSFIPRVAVNLHTGLTADCTGLAIDENTGGLLQTRPAFGGNIMATIVTPNHLPQMATVRHKVMDALEFDPTREGEIIEESVELNQNISDMEYKGFEKDDTQTVNLTEANCVIAGGRGWKKKENFL